MILVPGKLYVIVDDKISYGLTIDDDTNIRCGTVLMFVKRIYSVSDIPCCFFLCKDIVLKLWLYDRELDEYLTELIQ